MINYFYNITIIYGNLYKLINIKDKLVCFYFLYHISLNLVKSKCCLTANFDTYFCLFNINTQQKRCGSILRSMTNHD